MEKDGWFEQIRKLLPDFPELYRNESVSALLPLDGVDVVYISSSTALGWVLDDTFHLDKHEDALRLLLEAGANPNDVCHVDEFAGIERSADALTFARHQDDGRVLLQAGAIVRKEHEECWSIYRGPTRCHLLVKQFYQDSLRATAVVWCCDVLRATSSWPDMAFLLTCIMMDVSK